MLTVGSFLNRKWFYKHLCLAESGYLVGRVTEKDYEDGSTKVFRARCFSPRNTRSNTERKP
ncbi:MAG: hypothetical protein BWX80_00237 [Candidatus Hydrogenedentes bacterium ADurb.Bin101]|nr:MAG: hypothetical protein BWX80_00237 [Candidatus Hydrogenedentes bacterium ADurb.Bin101]